jgi:arsenate reductase
MAEGFLKSYDKTLEVYSGGTYPSNHTHPKAVIVMKEIGIDISSGFPQNVDVFLDFDFDYVVTVCDNAKQSCPVFQGNVKHQLHIGFEDPADAVGSDPEVLGEFRRIRDEIDRDFKAFYNNNLK